MGQPRPLFNSFSSFQTNTSNFTTNMYVKKCPSRIRCRDSNSWPLEHEPPPITTRPGLPPFKCSVIAAALVLLTSCDIMGLSMGSANCDVSTITQPFTLITFSKEQPSSNKFD